MKRANSHPIICCILSALLTPMGFATCSANSNAPIFTINEMHHSIKYALNKMQQQSNIPFSAEKDIEYRRIDVFCTKCPLDTLLPAIAYATGLTWSKTGGGYLLSRSPARYALEQERLHSSEMDH